MPKKQLSIFVDHCVHSAVVESLEQLHYVVETAASAGLAIASDEVIFKYCQATKQILLTYDADFGNILRFNPKNSFGIVVVYVYNVEKKLILKIIGDFFIQYTNKLKGNLYIVEHNQIRVWPKPRPTFE